MNDYLTRTDSFIASLGVEAYRVGGSVRDELLGRRVKDADYMVRGVSLNALGVILDRRPDVKVSPLKLRDGRQAGWRVSGRGLGLIEIVLPRKEVSTGPGHRDFKIVLDENLPLAEDAERRDFTFNALYQPILRWEDNPGDEYKMPGPQDPTGRGLYDLSHKLVTTTHPDSFRDDPLRTLRALRFVSTLGYDLSTETHAQMVEHADAVTGLSANGYASGTVLDELSKLLMGDDAVKALRLMRDTGVLSVLLPELAPMVGFDQGSRYHDLTTDEHTFTALSTAVHVDAPLRVRLALLFHDSGKPTVAWTDQAGRKHYYAYRGPDPDATEDQRTDHEVVGERIWREAASRLNAPRDLTEDVATLIRNHMVTVEGKIKPPKVRRARVKLGDSLLRDLYLHRMCDITGKGKPNQDHMKQIARLETIRQEAQKDGVPASVKDLAVTGGDLKALGLDGRAIGEALRTILDEVVCQPNDQLRSREWQVERAQSLL